MVMEKGAITVDPGSVDWAAVVVLVALAEAVLAVAAQAEGGDLLPLVLKSSTVINRHESFDKWYVLCKG